MDSEHLEYIMHAKALLASNLERALDLTFWNRWNEYTKGSVNLDTDSKLIITNPIINNGFTIEIKHTITVDDIDNIYGI